MYRRFVIVLLLLTSWAAAAVAQDDILINEILFNPAGPDSSAEWVELYNPGASPVDLDGWRLTDADSTINLYLPALELPAGGYLVVRLFDGDDDLDLSDGWGVYNTGVVWPVFDNDADACVLYAGLPDPSRVVDCVAWSATGSAPAGDALDDAVLQGEWSLGEYLDTSFGGNAFVAPWAEISGETIGRDALATDTDDASDWADHGGADALVCTPGRVNDGPYYLGHDLNHQAQWSLNQFLWEFGLDIENASWTGISVSESPAQVIANANHVFAVRSRQSGETATFSGAVACDLQDMGGSVWRLVMSGLMTSTRGSESLQFGCAVTDSARQVGLQGRNSRNATLVYTSPTGQTVTRQVDFSEDYAWTGPTTLEVADSRSFDDTRDPAGAPVPGAGLEGVRSGTVVREFLGDSGENAAIDVQTLYAAPAGAPSERMTYSADLTVNAQGGGEGSIGKKIKVGGRDIHLRVPGTFSCRSNGLLDILWVMDGGNDEVGYLEAECAGEVEINGDPLGSYVESGFAGITIDGETVPAFAFCVQGGTEPVGPAKLLAKKARWRDALRCINVITWSVVCSAAAIGTGGLGGGAAAYGCVAGAALTDQLISRCVPPAVGGTPSDDPPPLITLPRLLYQPSPGITAREMHLAQDSFPVKGILEDCELSTCDVRFDMAYNIAAPGSYVNDPGDSLVFDIEPVREGAVVSDVRLYFRLKRNPLFDAYRSSGLPDFGFAPGCSVLDIDGDRVEARWSFDLPDSDFLYPGDELHYFVQAVDDLGGDLFSYTMPPDTTGFSLFPGDADYRPNLYPESFVMRALPSLAMDPEPATPPILVWIERLVPAAYGYGTGDWEAFLRGLEKLRDSLRHLGYQAGIDYDVYYACDGGAGFGNGLDGRATPALIQDYETIVYASGLLAENTLSGGDPASDPTDDLALLEGWLQLGGKNLVLFGDNLARDLSDDAPLFLADWIGASYVEPDVRPLIGKPTTPPRVLDAVPLDGLLDSFEGVLFCAAPWDTIEIRYPIDIDPLVGSDAVLPFNGGSRVAVLESQGGANPYAALIHNHVAAFDDDVFFAPFDLDRLGTSTALSGPVSPLSARAWLLNDILMHCGHMGSGVPVTVPTAPRELTVRGYPNPFNPSIRIVYAMPARGEIAIRIYNLRGQLVRTLIDEPVGKGESFVIWDGTDEAGRAQASGVYFCRTRGAGKTITQKIALLK